MPRKRDRPPAVVAGAELVRVAQEIVTLLDERTDTESHRRAIYLLVANGPLYGGSPEAIDELRRLSVTEVDQIAQALQNYLRNAVRVRLGQPRIDLSGVRVSTVRVFDEAVSFMNGPILGLAALGLLMVLHLVGLKTFWPCAAPDCPRIFVKRYRREFCSQRCEKRTYKRRQRQDARERQARGKSTISKGRK